MPGVLDSSFIFIHQLHESKRMRFRYLVFGCRDDDDAWITVTLIGTYRCSEEVIFYSSILGKTTGNILKHSSELNYVYVCECVYVCVCVREC